MYELQHDIGVAPEIADLFIRLRIPQAHRGGTKSRRGGEAFPIGRESHGVRPGAESKVGELLVIGNVPEGDRGVATSRNEPRAVGREGPCPDVTAVRTELPLTQFPLLLPRHGVQN